MTDEKGFDLAVTVPAEQWAYVQRRMAFFEVLVVRVVQDRKLIHEWYGADELARLRLPGLPATRSGITRRASAEGWHSRRIGEPPQLRYHVTSLPGRAFDALLSRLMALPPILGTQDAIFTLPPSQACPLLPENTAPPWVLPLLRLLRRETGGDLGRAWQELPARLPPGIDLPDVREAARILVTLGLTRDI